MEITDLLARMGGLSPDGGARPGSAAGRLASMPDLNGDGHPLDDILRMAGRALR